MGYSVDLRMKAVKHRLEQSGSCAGTAKIFGVGRSTAQSRVRRYEETGDLSDKPLIRKPKKIDPDALRAYAREYPDDTQQETANAFHGSNQAIGKALRHLNITRKKTLRYKERDEEKIAAYPEAPEDIPPEKRVYTDESGSDSCCEREYGYAPR